MTKEEKRAYMKAYREKHKSTAKEYMRTYYASHKEKMIKRASGYNKSHPDKHRETARRSACKAYRKAVSTITTSMYQLPKDVIVLDDKHIRYLGNTYNISKNGYLTCGSKLLHIEYSKYLGIWFKGCEIHHKDGNVFNNTESNLEALTPEEHIRAHALLRVKVG